MEGYQGYSASEKGMMERVEKSHPSRIKLPSQLHAPPYTSSNENEYDLDAAFQISPATSIFKEAGWALAVRQTDLLQIYLKTEKSSI